MTKHEADCWEWILLFDGSINSEFDNFLFAEPSIEPSPGGWKRRIVFLEEKKLRLNTSAKSKKNLPDSLFLLCRQNYCFLNCTGKHGFCSSFMFSYRTRSLVRWQSIKIKLIRGFKNRVEIKIDWIAGTHTQTLEHNYVGKAFGNWKKETSTREE